MILLVRYYWLDIIGLDIIGLDIIGLDIIGLDIIGLILFIYIIWSNYRSLFGSYYP